MRPPGIIRVKRLIFTFSGFSLRITKFLRTSKQRTHDFVKNCQKNSLKGEKEPSSIIINYETQEVKSIFVKIKFLPSGLALNYPAAAAPIIYYNVQELFEKGMSYYFS